MISNQCGEHSIRTTVTGRDGEVAAAAASNAAVDEDGMTVIPTMKTSATSEKEETSSSGVAFPGVTEHNRPSLARTKRTAPSPPEDDGAAAAATAATAAAATAAAATAAAATAAAATTSAGNQRRKKPKNHDAIQKEAEKWIKDLQKSSNELGTLSVKNAILLDRLFMAGALLG